MKRADVVRQNRICLFLWGEKGKLLTYYLIDRKSSFKTMEEFQRFSRLLFWHDACVSIW